MKNENLKMKIQAGFSVIEVILAAGIFVVFSTGIVSVVLQGFDANRLGSEQTIANQYASEGIEAVRSIKDQNFDNLVATSSSGLARNGSGVWAFSGLGDTFGKYTRIASIAAVQRDSSGNIVASGGNVDANIVEAMVTVSWNFSPTRNNSVVLSEYFSNWKSGRGGMLVYGDGSTTSDAVKYRLFDANTNTWTATASAFDVDGTGITRALRAIRLYSSKTRNEKIAITRHYDSSSTIQYIYATVWNGTSWGTSTLLTSWTAATFLNALNFDGGYLNDGTFMVVYSKNTTTAQYRIWDGTSWSAGLTLPATLTGAPAWVVASPRPGTNEVMATFLTASSNTQSYYYSGSAWSPVTTHAVATPLNTARIIDFAWSPNSPTTGALVYAISSAVAKQITTKLFVANGSGGGTWGTAATASAQTNVVGALNIAQRPTANEYEVCNKDAAATPTINCNKVTFSGSTPTLSAATQISTTTDTGNQRSFDIEYESISGDPLLAVYSDNSSTPRFKQYAAGTSTWGSLGTIVTTGYAPGVFKTVRVVQQDQTNDMIALMADANLDLYTVFWDGTNNQMYTTPTALTTNRQGINGSLATEFWFDFAWDQY